MEEAERGYESRVAKKSIVSRTAKKEIGNRKEEGRRSEKEGDYR
jgi:hypothetical protein